MYLTATTNHNRTITFNFNPTIQQAEILAAEIIEVAHEHSRSLLQVSRSLSTAITRHALNSRKVYEDDNESNHGANPDNEDGHVLDTFMDPVANITDANTTETTDTNTTTTVTTTMPPPVAKKTWPT